MSILTQPWGSRKPSVGFGIDPSHPHSHGLVGLWLMNEGGGGNVQDSCRKNVGLLSDSPGWARTNTGGGLVFSGNNRVLTSQAFVASSWSYETVFYRTGKGTGADRLISANSSLECDIAIACLSSFGLTDNCFSVSGVTAYWQSYGSPLSLNTWYHAIVTYDGTNLNVYLNGALQTLTSGSVVFTSINGAIVFADYSGHSGGSNGNQFIGKIDWIAAWNRALTYTEVKERYVEPFAFMQTPTYLVRAAAAPAGGRLFSNSNLSGLQSGGPFFVNPLG